MNNEKVLDISWGTILKLAVGFLGFYLIYLIRDIIIWIIFGKVSVETDGKLGVEYGTYRYYRYVPADGICGGMTFYILAAYLENFQSSYGVGDEVSSCYDVFNWQDPHWYTIMGIEQYPAE